MIRDKRIIKVSIQGIIVNIVLVIFKSIMGLLTKSIAIILDAVNNLSDVLSSIITIVGTKLARKKPDKEHPYGHGRIEYFASIIIAIIVLWAGITSLKESILKILKPVQTEYTFISLLIIIVAVFVKLFFGKYVKKQGEDLKSSSLVASGVDAISDSIVSLSTFICAIISMIFHISLEGYLGVIISIIILKSAIEILKDTVNDMIGVRADSEITNKLKTKILSYKEVQGVFDLILHNYGPNNIIATAHIQVDDDINARDIHRITRTISIDVYKTFGIIITIGIYASNDKGEYGKIQKYLSKITKDNPNILQIHGFYVDEKINKISFDIIFNFEEKYAKEVVEDISSKLKAKFPNYEYDIVIDMDFSDL